MKAIILAAGRGSRLGELTREKPKCMCMLQGRTLLDRCLESLEQAGFARADIGIVTGYRRELFQAHGVTYFNNPDWEKTNMFWSLTMARAWLEQSPCLVCYSDIVFAPGAAKALAQCDAPAALTYYTEFWPLWEKRMQNPLEDLETFRVGTDGRLTEIGRRPQSRQEVQGQYMGLIRFTPKSWQWAMQTIRQPLPKTVEKLDMTTLLQGMLEQGREIQAIPTSELWLECDTEQDIRVYEKEFAGRL